MDIFRVLGNENRRKILQLLFEEELHINGISKKLGISLPVVFKHVKILEKNNLVDRRKVGNVHLLKINSAYVDTVRRVFSAVEKDYVIKAKKGETLLEALKKVSEIEIKKEPNGYFIESIEGKAGYFLFKLNGKIPNKSLEKIRLIKDYDLSFYHLSPVLGKRFLISVE